MSVRHVKHVTTINYGLSPDDIPGDPRAQDDGGYWLTPHDAYADANPGERVVRRTVEMKITEEWLI